MKIIYLTDQIRLHGGAEKILIQKLNYWANHYEYDVTLITTDQRLEKPFIKLDSRINHYDLAVDYTEGVSFFSLENISKVPNHFLKLKRTIDKIKPDAIFVISRSYVRFLTPFVARKYLTFNEYHTSYYSSILHLEKSSLLVKLKFRLTKYLIDSIEKHYTKIVFLNKEEFDYYNLDNGVIVPNFFDNTVPVNNVKKRNIVISLGRLCHQKGYDLLIDAWEVLDAQIDGWELNIYGNGDDYGALSQKLETKKLKNPIFLKSAVNNVNEKLSESALYVMSSRFETFPMVLLEALSNSLPVVSFDSPTGARSILKNGEDSLLAEPNDIIDLANKILSLLQNQTLRELMGKNGLGNVMRFNAEEVMKKWDLLIKLNKK